MDVAVHFNRNAEPRTVEVDEEALDQMLPQETMAVEFSTSEMLPEDLLRWRRVLPGLTAISVVCLAIANLLLEIGEKSPSAGNDDTDEGNSARRREEF